MAIPPMYYQFLNRPEFREHAKQWSHVRLFTCGSAPIRPEVLPELESILKNPLINRYGMTESHVIASLPIDRPSVQGSVGLPLTGVEMTMVEDGSKTKEGHAVGEVHVKGPVIFTHYLNRPEATAKAFAHEGYFATGDLGFLSHQGYLTLIGRKVDLIITKGFNVYPPMVERVLNDCPGVKESAVFGLPDDLRGEKSGGDGSERPRYRARSHAPQYPRLLPRTQRGLPGAERRLLCGRTPTQRHGQGAKTRTARRPAGGGWGKWLAQVSSRLKIRTSRNRWQRFFELLGGRV